MPRCFGRCAERVPGILITDTATQTLIFFEGEIITELRSSTDTNLLSQLFLSIKQLVCTQLL